MMKTKTKWIGGGLVLLLLILLVVAVRQSGKHFQYEVTVEKVQKRDIQETISAAGNIQAKIEVKISSEVSGEIVEILVTEGQRVKKGDLLVRIRPDIYVSARDRMQAALSTAKANYEQAQSALKQAKAQYLNAELAFKRNEKLFQEKVISPAEFDNATASFEVAKAQYESAQHNVEAALYNVKSAEAALKEANDNLNKTLIFSPVDAIVTTIARKVGERVVGTNMMDGTEIMRLADLSELEVKVEVNENDIVRVNVGDTAIVEVDAYLGEKFKGVVEKVSQSSKASSTAGLSSSSAQTVNFDVTIRLLHDSYRHLITETNPYPFKSGMTATVEIYTERVTDVWAVPIQAVVMREDTNASSQSTEKKEAIFVLEGNKARIRYVKTGLQDLKYIQIKEGIQDTLLVITGPYNVLAKDITHGDIVSVKKT